MILDRNDALYAANVFVDYFSNFGRIDDYLRKVKLERMSNYPVSLLGLSTLEDDMFDKFDMHPNDMEFECKEVSNEIFVNYLEIVTSHAVEVSMLEQIHQMGCVRKEHRTDCWIYSFGFTNNQLKTS